MPNIEQFEAGPGKIEVNDRGAESFAQAGRRAGVAFNQLGQETEKTYDIYHQHQVDVDTSNTLTAQSTLDVNAHHQLMTLVNDPRAMDHPEMGEAFLQDYNQRQDDIVAHATTDEARRVAQRTAAERKDQMAQRVASEMSTLAGAKFAANRDTYVQNNAGMAADEPSRTVALVADIESHWGTTAPHNLSAEGVAQNYTDMKKAQTRVALSGVLSAAHLGEEQIAAGKPGDAIDAMEKQLDSGVLDDYIGDNKAELRSRLEVARTQGQSRFEQAQKFGQEQIVQQGKGEYADIDAQLQPYIHGNLVGQTPPPALMQRVAGFTQQYGKYMPGESHDLQELAASSTNPQDFEKLGGTAAGAARLETRLLTGDRTVDEAAINAALRAGQKGDTANGISIEQAKVLKSLLPPKGTETNPAMKQSMAALNVQVTKLETSLPPGPMHGYVASIMQHDAVAAFSGWASSEGDPAKALDIVTNVNNPHNFKQLLGDYQAAARASTPAQADAILHQRLKGFASAGYGAGAAEGSVVSPVLGPTAGQPSPPPGEGAPPITPSGAPLAAARAAQLAKWAGGH